MAEHTVKAFTEELDALTQEVARMGGLAEMAVNESIAAVARRDTELAQAVIERDAKIDRAQREVEKRAIKLFALRQPMADDLRMLIAALRIGGAIERIGDYARNIAKRTLTLAQVPSMPAAQTVARLGQLVQRMLKNILDAYLIRDADKAEDVRRSDREVDAMYTSLVRELLTYMMEDPRNITPCTQLMFAAKNIERVGDHITTIAENVIYLVRGDIIENKRPDEGPESFAVISGGGTKS